MHELRCIRIKDLKRPKPSYQADLKAACKQEVRHKTELLMAWLSVARTHQLKANVLRPGEVFHPPFLYFLFFSLCTGFRDLKISLPNHKLLTRIMEQTSVTTHDKESNS